MTVIDPEGVAYMENAEELAALILSIARNPIAFDAVRRQPENAPTAPSVRELIRLAGMGAKCADSSSLGGAAKRNSTHDEDMAISAEFVRRLKSPLRDTDNTATQIIWTIARDRRRSGKETVLSRSGVHAAIKRECKRGVRGGIQNTGECKLRVCHCAVVEETKRYAGKDSRHHDSRT